MTGYRDGAMILQPIQQSVDRFLIVAQCDDPACDNPGSDDHSYIDHEYDNHKFNGYKFNVHKWVGTRFKGTKRSDIKDLYSVAAVSAGDLLSSRKARLGSLIPKRAAICLSRP